MKLAKAGVLSSNTGFGKAGKDQIEKLAPEYGIQIVANEVYDSKATDLTAEVTKVKAAGGVTEAAVVGRPSAEWGEEVCAFVVARSGAAPAPADLDALCLEHIARFKRPKAYFFVDGLPKNNTGKVLKTSLREALQTHASCTRGRRRAPWRRSC